MSKQRPIWNEWKRITRLHNVVTYLISQELRRSEAFPAQDRSAVQLGGPPFNRGFKLKLNEYDAALSDKNSLAAMVLVFSWALFEEHCTSILKELKDAGRVLPWKDEYLNSVEQWAPLLLKVQGTRWDSVLGGEPAIVEAATIRNALAHGERFVTQSMFHRMSARGMSCGWSVGDPVQVDFGRCESLRASLKSFARLVEGRKKALRTPTI